MVSNIHSCHSTETMYMSWLVILTDQSTSLLSPCAVLKSSCSQWTLRHEKAVDVATMSISQSERRSDPPLARLKTRSFCTFRNLSFDRSTTEDKPLYLTRLTSFTGKNRPKAKAKDTVSSFPKTGKQHLTLWPATHLPRSNHRLLWAAIMHTPHSTSTIDASPQHDDGARTWRWYAAPGMSQARLTQWRSLCSGLIPNDRWRTTFHTVSPSNAHEAWHVRRQSLPVWTPTLTFPLSTTHRVLNFDCGEMSGRLRGTARSEQATQGVTRKVRIVRTFAAILNRPLPPSLPY